MKCYALFAGDFYYPSGGWGDFRASYDTKSKAVREGKKLVRSGERDWFQVVDLTTQNEVCSGRK